MKQYRIIAAADHDLIGTDVEFSFIPRLRSSGWSYRFIADRQVHLLHRQSVLGSTFIEVSHLTMTQTFDLVMEGN